MLPSHYSWRRVSQNGYATWGYQHVNFYAVQSVDAEKGKGRQRTALIFTELPYRTNKATLIESIADLVNTKQLEGIADVRDESSSRDGIRVVVELTKKKDIGPVDTISLVSDVQNCARQLFSKTSLQSVFAGQLLLLADEGQTPKIMGLKEILQNFVNFRLGVLLSLRSACSFDSE
jgi:DNA gyrase subunit A